METALPSNQNDAKAGMAKHFGPDEAPAYMATLTTLTHARIGDPKAWKRKKKMTSTVPAIWAHRMARRQNWGLRSRSGS